MNGGETLALVDDFRSRNRIDPAKEIVNPANEIDRLVLDALTKFSDFPRYVSLDPYNPSEVNRLEGGQRSRTQHNRMIFGPHHEVRSVNHLPEAIAGFSYNRIYGMGEIFFDIFDDEGLAQRTVVTSLDRGGSDRMFRVDMSYGSNITSRFSRDVLFYGGILDMERSLRSDEEQWVKDYLVDPPAGIYLLRQIVARSCEDKTLIRQTRLENEKIEAEYDEMQAAISKAAHWIRP